MQNTLPQFEANQVLSNAHLNQFIQYLEEQGRLTRNHLLGAGIVSGLDVKRNTATTVSVYEGVGVTSAGYLVIPGTDNWPAPDENGRRFITYNRRKKYEPKSLLSPYAGDFETVANSYSLFKGTANEIFVLIESTVTNITDTNVKNLSTAELNEHVLILFLEINVKELKSCEGEDCIDLGRQITYTVQPLLVSKTDADIILKNESDATSQLDGAAAINLTWQMSDIVVSKPDLAAITSDFMHVELASIYNKVISQLVKKLGDTNAAIDNSLKKILKTNVTVIGDFQKKLNDIQTTISPQKNPGIYQYVYDFACDFVAAYRELQDAVHEYCSYEVPPSLSYPSHIRLGEVPAAVNGIASSFNFPSSVYRHTFVNSRNVEMQRKAYHTAQVLFARLTSLTENFKPDLNKDDIRITPSVEPGIALSERSIPFYYAADDDKRSTLLPVWNSEFVRQGKLNRIYNYYTNANMCVKDKFNNGHDVSKDDPSFFPLMYNNERSNFYRIEGYSGLQLLDVFDELQSYIHNYSLPFDLQLVGLNRTTQLVIKEMRLRFNDLDSMYNVMCEEILCLLTTELNYFKNIRLTKRLLTRPPVVVATPVAVPQEALIMPAVPAAGTFFFRGERKKPSVMIKSASKAVETIDLGIVDSTEDIVKRIGRTVPTKDIGNIIGTIGTIFIPTAASSYVLKLVASIEKLIASLKEDFNDFNSDEYNRCLTNMHTETKEFISFAKPQSAESLFSDNNMDREESLGYLERLLYECDFEKIPAIDEERDKREHELGFNTNLAQYIGLHPGVEHKAGVWKGGTFIIIFDRGGQVIADFCLPYRCCGGMNTTQFVLGVLKTIWMDGQVLDKDGAPVDKAKVTLNDESLAVDKNGRFRKIIPPNTFLVLRANADGFEPFEISITSGEDDMVQAVKMLKKAEIPMGSLNIKITDNSSQPINEANIKSDDIDVKTNNAGEVLIRVKANAKITLTITKPGYLQRAETIDTQAAALSLSYKLTKIIKLSGAITKTGGTSVPDAKAFIDDKQITVTGNNYSTELEDSRTYRLTITAPDLQTFTKDVTTGFIDIDIPVELQPVKTLNVRVGIYDSIEQPRPTTPVLTTHATVLNPEIVRTSAATRTAATGGIGGGLLRRTTPPARSVEVLVERTTQPPLPPPPPPPPADKFRLKNNGSVSTFISDKAQIFNAGLGLFESQEIISVHRLVVRDMATPMEFASALTVSDCDILALVHAVRGKQSENQFSFLIGLEGAAPGVDIIANFNRVMSEALSLAPQQLASGKTIDVRVFTKSDAVEIGGLLERKGIPFLRRQFGI